MARGRNRRGASQRASAGRDTAHRHRDAAQRHDTSPRRHDAASPSRRRSAVGAIAVSIVLALVSLGAWLLASRDRGAMPAATSDAAPAVPRPPAADLDPQVAAAIEGGATAVEGEPGDASRWGRLGRVYESSEYYTLARACYEEARRLDPDTAEWTYHLGRLAADRGEPAEAVRHFEEALQLDPSSLPALLRLADARLRAGDLAGAEAAYGRAVELAPAAPWGRVGLARLRRRQGRVEDARRLLEEALTLEPRDREASYLLGTIYAELGREHDARDLMDRFQTSAAVQWPPDPYLDRVMAEATGAQMTLRRANRLLGEGKLDEAEPLYQAVLGDRPDDFAALINLGNLRLRRGDHRRAIELLERAVAQRPQDPHPRFGLAMAFFASGARERGLAELDEVIRLDPNHREARALAERARTGAR